MFLQRCKTITLAALATSAVTISLAYAESSPIAAQFTAEGELIKPDDYREWILIGTGLNMAYGPLRKTANRQPPFTNVFVNPSSYREFLKSGTWPNGTMFILEVRESIALNNSVTGNNGHFQGKLIGIEAEVKDEARFPGKWAFFSLRESKPTGQQIPAGASCYSCHATNAAVDNTFVQFYPVLRDIAKERGRLKAVPETF